MRWPWNRLPVGTRSILVGAHQFLLHPLFVAWAWARLYGRPGLREWVSFFVHDLGYWGIDDLEGRVGEEHVRLGGRIMTRLFGPAWGFFAICHSRYWAKKHGMPVSKLCIADKASFLYVPQWLYLWQTRLTGELEHYLRSSVERCEADNPIRFYAEHALNPYFDRYSRRYGERRWHDELTKYVCLYVDAHKDGGKDTMTPTLSAWTKED